jgi:type I restriction enzyme M protein
MADEKSQYYKEYQNLIPKGYDWQSLKEKEGEALEDHYNKLLTALGKEEGMLGQIFLKAQNKIQNPSRLTRLVNMIDDENWSRLGEDVKGDIYEGLLEKFAEDTKSGAGQYFTPRVLIQAMVECIKPEPERNIADPACGTGGFFLAAKDYITREYANEMDKGQKQFLKYHTFKGWEIVPNTARLCLMNLFLHNIGDLNSEPPIERNDSLLTSPSEKFDYVLTNPPFGKKSSYTITNEDGEQNKETLSYNRQDFWSTSSNKQLNFVQHIKTMLKENGEAAVVIPDNVLFEGGSAEIVRKRLLDNTELHTILRLPTGIFYKQGVKANVVFFVNKPASKEPWTKETWIYDLRTNMHFTLKENQMTYEHLRDFVKCYNPDNRHNRQETERFKRFTYEDITNRDKTSLDLFWLKDESLGDMENLPEPDVLANDIIENLEAGLESFKEVQTKLNINNHE